MLDRCTHGLEHYVYLTAHQISKCRRPSAVWHMLQVDTGLDFEQFPVDVPWRAVSRRGHIHLAGICLRVCDELRDASCRQRRIYDHDERCIGDSHYRYDVASEIESG